MKNALRVAHCADIHLDGHVGGGGRGGEFYRNGFAAALADIRAHSPDLMLFAGDLFDSNRASADTIEWAMQTLGQQPFPIVMIPGNHDCLADDAIFKRYDFNAIPNVRLLMAGEGEIARLPDLGVAVWGKGMVEHCDTYRPIGGCPDRPVDCRWYLGLGHGFFVPHGGQAGRSSPIHMQDLEASACDYLALGHHHAAMEIVTDKATAAYSGSPTDQFGRGATYAMVDMKIGSAPVVKIHTIG